jgi:hypothetical protein
MSKIGKNVIFPDTSVIKDEKIRKYARKLTRAISDMKELRLFDYSQILCLAGMKTSGSVIRQIGTLADDAKPSISGKDIWLTGGTTTITDFDDGVEGQIITVIAEHSVTITDGTNIFLNGSANWDMTETDTLTLICKENLKWYETSRGDNGA